MYTFCTQRWKYSLWRSISQYYRRYSERKTNEIPYRDCPDCMIFFQNIDNLFFMCPAHEIPYRDCPDCMIFFQNIDNLFFICPANEKPFSWWEIGFFHIFILLPRTSALRCSEVSYCSRHPLPVMPKSELDIRLVQHHTRG